MAAEIVKFEFAPETETSSHSSDTFTDSAINKTSTAAIIPTKTNSLEQKIELHVYPQRWIILIVVAILNCSNTMLWISLSPVANYANVFYGKGANWFSLVFIVTTIPVAFGAMYAGSRFGIRSAILVAAWANGVGACIRLSSSWLPHDARFPVGIAGQAIGSVAYPFIMFLPTTVAGAWFGDTQRALATTIGIMSNPLGVLLANFITPHVVQRAADIRWLNLAVAIFCVTGTLLATIGVTRSKPKLPPTVSASQPETAFFPGIKRLFTSWSYMLLLIVMGGGIAIFNALYTVMEQLLCPMGYTNGFAGLVAGLMIIGGVLGATASGIFVDRTKKYILTMKVCLVLAIILFVGLLQLALRPYLQVYIAVCAFVFGLAGLASYPVGLEMSAECSYPVSQTLSTGFIVLSGQIQSALYILIITMLEKPLDKEEKDLEKCSTSSGKVEAWDMSISTYVLSGIGAVMALMLLVFFKPKLRRMIMDRSQADLKSMAPPNVIAPQELYT